MIHLAQFSIRRPFPALLIWVLVAGALALVGLGIRDNLSPTITTVAGSESARAQQLANEEFGPSQLVPIMLQGDPRQLDRQGPELVRRLAARPDTRVMSPWDGGAAAKALRPNNGTAMIVASVAHSESDMISTYQAQINRTVDYALSGNVTWHISGQPTIDKALKDGAIDTTRIYTLIALGALFVLLVLILQRPVAAAMVTGFGLGTVAVSFGVMTLAAKVVDVDATTLAIASMVGLGLGTGYSLIILRRFEAEEPAGIETRAEKEAAATRAVATTGRAVLVGGTAVILCLILAVIIAPTEILTSLGIGALVCATLAIGAAVVVMPALLVLLGHKLDLGRFPVPRPLLTLWDRLVNMSSFVTARAIGMGAVATALLLVMAIPALSLETGPPDVKQLPEDSLARKDFEAINKTMGAGWATPFNILVVSGSRPITDKALLASIERYQASIAKDPRVASVAGPGEFVAQTKDLNKLPKSLRSSTKLLKNGKKDLGRLENGLGQAGAGAKQLRSGLQQAASGATALQSGSGQAGSGAGQLRAGLDKARSGALQISGGLGEALTGANALRNGAAKALAGSKQLTAGIGQAAGPVKQGYPAIKQMAGNISSANGALGPIAGQAQSTTQSLDTAIAALQARAGEPGVADALSAVRAARDQAAAVSSGLGGVQSKVAAASGVAGAFATQVGQLSQGLGQLLAGATQLQGGIGQLRTGNAQLAGGIARLNTGGGQLTTGLTALRNGAAQLESGLGQLTGGAGQLAGGLSAGTGPTGQLVNGLGQLQAGVTKFRGQLPSAKDLEQLNKQSPGLFTNGYFTLAAIQGAPSATRRQASFAVNLDRGGNAGQIVVISKYASADKRTRELASTLQDSAARFGTATKTDTAVGGPAGNVTDFQTITAGRILPVVLALALATGLLLASLLRMVVLPLVAVAFDLLVCAASFGVLWLLFGGSDPVLGGPGYLDPMSVIGVFAAVFGLAVLYEVALLERAREAFERTGDHHAALLEGMRGTAGGASGAALAMLAATVPFAFSNMVTIQQFAIGVAVAIVLGGFIVRPVLLPAAVQVLGHWAWWPAGRHHRQAPAPPPMGALGGPGPTSAA